MKPFGPAPRIRAKESVIMMRKITILMREVTYSNQAKILFGRRKMAIVTAEKRVTGWNVNQDPVASREECTY